MSMATFNRSELGAAGRVVYQVLRTLRLGHVEESENGDIKINNLTIINLVLYAFGPMKEWKLTSILLLFQCVCSSAALLVRYKLAGLLYDIVE